MKKILLIALISLVITAPALAADITLSWEAPTDPRVVSYNVYYAPILADLEAATPLNTTSTSIVIPGLAEGQTYYFGAKSVDTNSVLSAMSDVIHYLVDAPPQVIEIPARPRSIMLNFTD